MPVLLQVYFVPEELQTFADFTVEVFDLLAKKLILVTFFIESYCSNEADYTETVFPKIIPAETFIINHHRRFLSI